MKSSARHSTADREKTGGIYAGAAGFTIVWITGFAHGVPFRTTTWRGIGCAVVLYMLTTFLLRIVLRIETSDPPIEDSEAAATSEVEEGS